MGSLGEKTSLFDSLPYYDNDLEQYPMLKEKVERELAREPKPPTTTHPLVPPAYELFKNHPLLAAELARVEAHEAQPALDNVRYQLPGPASGTDEEWRRALGNAHAQLEHQRIRQGNLGLLQAYGSNAWRMNNYVLEATATQTEGAVEELKERTTEVNRGRKAAQTGYGEQLGALETRWTEVLSGIVQNEMANMALESEIGR